VPFHLPEERFSSVYGFDSLSEKGSQVAHLGIEEKQWRLVL